MKSTSNLTALALAAAAMLSVPAFAQTFGPLPSTVSRNNGNVSVTGTAINETALNAPLTPEAASDQQLLTQIVTALSTDARMTGAQINVEVNAGRVTLGGVARDTAQSQAARSIADDVAGPANVTNRLTTGG